MADKEDVIAEAKDITGGEGVALVVDCAGVAIVLNRQLISHEIPARLLKSGMMKTLLIFHLTRYLIRA